MAEPTVVTAGSVAEWRAWLAEHHDAATEGWLVIPHKNSGIPGPTYAEAVEQALCFGWIDGLQRRHDEHSARLRFTPRRPKSKWSAPNRERVARMIREGQMTEAGQAAIDRAKADGTWDADATAANPAPS
jgi:uncharacterized protein YdeI (YjbR/CyaY-like superfamily)